MKTETKHSPTKLIKITLLFASGLTIGRSTSITPLTAQTVTAILLFSFFLLLLFKKQRALPLALYLFLPIGVLLSDGYGSSKLNPHDISRYANGSKICIEGRVLERNEGENGTAFTVLSEKIILSDRSKAVEGKLRLSIASGAESIGRGDRIRFIARLKLPRNFGNPGGFDYEQFLADRGIYATAFMSDDTYLAKTAIGGGTSSVFFHFRNKLRKIIDDSTEGTPSGILKAISMGDKSAIDEDAMTLFRKTGVAHILAISGLHMGIAAFFFFTIFKKLLSISEQLLIRNCVTKGAALLTFFPLTAYLLISGMSTSAMRAFIMAGAFLMAVIISRESETLNTIATAALIILVIWPQALFDVAFQLSFAAVIAIVYISPKVETALFQNDVQSKRQLIRKSITFLIVSAAAIAGTAPLTAHYFMETSLVGMAGNIIAIPLIGFVAVPLSMISLIVATFSTSAAAIVFGIAGNIVSISIEPLKYLASLPFSSVLLSPPSWPEITFYYLLIWSFLNIKNKMAKTALVVIPVFYITPIVGEAFIEKNREMLSVTFLSVGQGESTVIRFPGGKTMLVDGGGFYNDSFDTGEMVIRPYLLSQGIKRIDYMVMTHPHPDHIGGLLHILKEFQVGEVWSSGDIAKTERYKAFEKLISNKNIPEKTVTSKHPNIEIGGVSVSFLMPYDIMSAKDSSNSGVNNRSVVIKLSYGRHSFLLTSDMEAESEALLIKRGLNIKADIMKVAHHGSLSSSTLEFIDAVSPVYAVVTAGYNNRFGFPKDEVVKRFIDKKAILYRTDIDGAISFISDGKTMKVKTFRGSSAVRSSTGTHHL